MAYMTILTKASKYYFNSFLAFMFQAYQFAGQSPDLISLLCSLWLCSCSVLCQSVPFLLWPLSCQSFWLSSPRFLHESTRDGSDNKLLFPSIVPTIEVGGLHILRYGNILAPIIYIWHKGIGGIALNWLRINDQQYLYIHSIIEVYTQEFHATVLFCF